MSQYNATYALKKIQTAFGTDLFIRKGRKLVPSEFGWHVYGRTEAYEVIERSMADYTAKFGDLQEMFQRFKTT